MEESIVVMSSCARRRRIISFKSAWPEVVNFRKSDSYSSSRSAVPTGLVGVDSSRRAKSLASVLSNFGWMVEGLTARAAMNRASSSLTEGSLASQGLRDGMDIGAIAKLVNDGGDLILAARLKSVSEHLQGALFFLEMLNVVP